LFQNVTTLQDAEVKKIKKTNLQLQQYFSNFFIMQLQVSLYLCSQNAMFLFTSKILRSFNTILVQIF